MIKHTSSEEIEFLGESYISGNSTFGYSDILYHYNRRQCVIVASYLLSEVLPFSYKITKPLLQAINILNDYIDEKNNYRVSLDEFCSSPSFKDGLPLFNLPHESAPLIDRAYSILTEENFQENLALMIGRACRITNKTGSANKEISDFCLSLFSYNEEDLNDPFFQKINYFNIDDLKVLFDYLEDKYPDFDLILRKENIVEINFPPYLPNIFLAGRDNEQLANRILNFNYNWIPLYLKRLCTETQHEQTRQKKEKSTTSS